MGGPRNSLTGQHALAGNFLPVGYLSAARWSIAMLAAAGLMGAASPAAAAPSGFWPDYYDPYLQPSRPLLSRVRKPRRLHLPRAAESAKDARKPHGPLILAISVEKQLLTVYDADGVFAQTPVSTGMRGHATPMGVFSVIQKQKYHRSNIYSGAPMPYMQRITWSGVAMHAGMLPGYPASHGCIRMPMNFAVKMWGWTRMGTRVVITPGELAPESFSHPLLASRKTAPVAAAETRTEVATAAKSDRAPVAEPQPELELKSTLGHDLARPAPTTQTADASGALARQASPATLVDAPVGVDRPLQPEGPAAEAEAPVIPELKKDQARPSDAQQPGPKPDTVAAPKRGGQIAVFVSKKDARLYVRQNFAPLFDVPVTIAGDGPLGTHLFTARADKDDATLVHWSVVSMPVPARHSANLDHDATGSLRRKLTGAVEVKAETLNPSAGEALDRLTIPVEAISRINEALSTGSSIIVSDQGINTGETGIGTDFIIPLH